MRKVPFLILLLAGLAGPVPAQSGGGRFGVFLRLVDAPAGSFDPLVEAMEPALVKAGWPLLASYDAATGGCRYHAKVFVISVPSYHARVLERGARAAFAIPVRLVIFEDEAGVHVGATNPQSLARTMVGEDFTAAPAELVGQLHAFVAGGFLGKSVAVQYGQFRDKGLIEKTMGIVAGGPFPDKVEELRSVKATGTMGVKEVADRIVSAGVKPRGRWGMQLVYRLDLPDRDAVLLGFNGAPMEARSYQIVGSGDDESRAKFACPGLDHAAAYPVELLIVRERDQVKVLAIDMMFRMKIYFEDAGKMKFAANMAMPGSIEDELRDLVEESF